jgi:hypothetical protein
MLVADGIDHMSSHDEGEDALKGTSDVRDFMIKIT